MRFVTGRSVREITSLPGCNQIAISHGAFIWEHLRGSGIGLEEHNLALDEMRRLGYDYALCTVRDNNIAQKRILIRAGWKRLDDFPSSYTGNNICIYGFNIKEEGKVTEGKMA